MEPERSQPKLATRDWIFLSVAGGLLVASVAGRLWFASAGSGGAPGGASGFAADGTGNASEAATITEKSLPYLTAASLAALLGFAAGYALKKIAKAALVILGILVIASIVLSATGVLSIEWESVRDTVNRWLLDAKEKLPTAEALLRHAPAAATFGAGLVLGAKSG